MICKITQTFPAIIIITAGEIRLVTSCVEEKQENFLISINSVTISLLLRVYMLILVCGISKQYHKSDGNICVKFS